MHLGQDEVALTPTEFSLLVHLADRPGTIHRREAIMADVWDHTHDGPSRTLDVHVGGLRHKLGAAWIQTVRGVGFRLVERDPAEDVPTQ